MLAGSFASTLFVSFGGLFLLPLLVFGGWIVLWLSPLWTDIDKLAGTILMPAIGVVTFVFRFMPTTTESCHG